MKGPVRFLGLYRELAEPLPNEKSSQYGPALELVTVDAEHPLFSIAMGLGAGDRVGKKSLRRESSKTCSACIKQNVETKRYLAPP